MNQIATQNTTKYTDARTIGNVKKDIMKTVSPKKQKFYDFYLEEHQNMACRRLHFAGAVLAYWAWQNLLRLVRQNHYSKASPLATLVLGLAISF